LVFSSVTGVAAAMMHVPLLSRKSTPRGHPWLQAKQREKGTQIQRRRTISQKCCNQKAARSGQHTMLRSWLSSSSAPLRRHFSAVSTIREELRKYGGGSVSVELNGPIANITLANPARRNALTPFMMASFADVVDRLERWDDGSCVILQGAEGWFCAGMDLSFAVDEMMTPAAGRKMCLLMTDTLNRLHNCNLISVAVIEGGALGGGAETSTACDFRVIEQSAFVHFVHPRMGVTPGLAC
jgi:ethylmalonyl-CoA/methylmalonyl-CoA decarboxylase